jgi:D-sedoheptulose 7-phosphate isomerase
MSKYDLEEDFIAVSKALEEFRSKIDLVVEAGETAGVILENGGSIFFCGNGGSAADSQHWAAELTGRFLFNRPAIRAVALTVDTSAITAIGNDFGFDEIFARQLEGLARQGDLLIGITTSGNSKNILEAAKKMKSMGGIVILFSGPHGGSIDSFADIVINCPGNRTDLIQDIQILLGHSFCKVVEKYLVNNQGPK